MKLVSIIILQIFAVVTANVSFVWAIVGFILYLVKDTPFHWWSVYTFIISIIAIVITRTIRRDNKRGM